MSKKALIALMVVFLAALPLAAQKGRGNIYGIVVDTEGNPLPGVTVTLTGLTEAPMTMVSNEEGRFRFLNLEPGESVEGFLVGSVPIRNKKGESVDRWQLLVAGEPEPVILPSHYDLDQKLREVWADGAGEGSWVWIAYLGKRKVKIGRAHV